MRFRHRTAKAGARNQTGRREYPAVKTVIAARKSD